jgi:hypothetical protein
LDAHLATLGLMTAELDRLTIVTVDGGGKVETREL